MLTVIFTALFMVAFIFTANAYTSGCCANHECANVANNCGICGAGLYTSLGQNTVSYPCNCNGDASLCSQSCVQCTCANCSPGRYCPGNGCSYPCPGGQFQGISTQAACNQCPAGQYSSEGATGCSLCPVGKSQPFPNQPGCNICPPGQCQPYENQPGCNLCAVGKYQPNSEQRECSKCPAGQYQSSEGQVGCKNCPQGQYQGSEGQGGCNPCPKGQYQPNQGQGGCSNCPQGKYQSSLGQVDCIYCPEGQYQPNQGQESCINCPSGRYQPSQGQTGCGLCPIGQYQPYQGKPGCYDCPKGQYNPNQEQASCTNCPQGTYNVDTGSQSITACALCAAGKYNPDYGSTTSDACILCEVGKFGSISGLSACVSCPIRYFSYQFNIPGATICYPNPTSIPSSQPSCQPSSQPSSQPTKQPSCQPSRQPSLKPSSQPTTQPTVSPSIQPSSKPSNQPSEQPSSIPTLQPNYRIPSTQPSMQPISKPSRQPSYQPSSHPTRQPSQQPFSTPSSQPSRQPTYIPTRGSSNVPTIEPSHQPTLIPTYYPSLQPIQNPTKVPTDLPSKIPLCNPSNQPHLTPSTVPSRTPSYQPFKNPSHQPIITPSKQPESIPTIYPSCCPIVLIPTTQPTTQPSMNPSSEPSINPTIHPSLNPSNIPSNVPSAQPRLTPSCFPSRLPSVVPKSFPSKIPSNQPSILPIRKPSDIPTLEPSSQPSKQPLFNPSKQPTCSPSADPSSVPSYQPSQNPTTVPSTQPSHQPTTSPQSIPSLTPSLQPSYNPVCKPSKQPSKQPVVNAPSIQPSSVPSFKPVGEPTNMPSCIPLNIPTCIPTFSPSLTPLTCPTFLPISYPTSYPTSKPSIPKIFKFPAPNISEIIILSNNVTSQIFVEIYLSNKHPSLVFCAGVGIDKEINNNQIIAYNYFSFANNGQAKVLIAGLVPSNFNNIYCTTISLSGFELSANLVKKNKVLVFTSCCKSLSYFIGQSDVISGSINFNFIKFDVEHSPSVSVKIRIELIPVAGSANLTSDSITTYLSPNIINLTKNNTSPTISNLILIAGSESDYFIVVTLDGPSAKEYSIISPVNNIFTVFSKKSVYPPPIATSAIFSDDGSYVSISFNSATNKAKYYSKFKCSELLYFNDVDLSNCVWETSTTINVYPFYKVSNSSANIIIPGSTITILSNKIKAFCDVNSTMNCHHIEFMKKQNLTIQISKNPQTPIVSISAPASVSSCNDLIIDLTNSVGNGGRPWVKINFEVTETGIGNSSQILSFLNSNKYNIYPPTPIPSKYLFPGQTYAFKIYLTNFLGMTGYDKYLVYVTDTSNISPMLSMLGQASRVIYSYSFLQLNSVAYMIKCDGVISYSNLTYFWTVSEFVNGNYVKLNLNSESQNNAVFKLSPFRLIAKRQYIINLQVVYSNGMQQFDSTVKVSISVVPSSIVAVIADASIKTITVNKMNSVDASISYDQDVSPQSNNTKLSFSWTCLQISPSFSLKCPLNLLDTAKAVLMFNSSSTSLGTTSRLTVSVSDITRVSTAYVDVIVISEKVSQLSISSPSGSFTSVNTNNKLVLLGSMKLVHDCQAEWSVDNLQIDLNEISLTAVTANFKASLSDSSSLFYLCLPPYCLTGNTKYIFTLSCGKSLTSVIVTTNSGPLPGLFAIDPKSGIELSTLFQLSAFEWTDPDLPLKYQFGFVSETSLINLIIVSISELTFTSTRLPAGPKERNYLTNCTLNVFDNNMASTFTNSFVEVTSVNISAKLDAMAELLSSKSSGSINDKTNLISTASAALNTVNCSLSPNCTKLNRNQCLKTSHSCGSCLSGYMGDIQDCNVPCISMSISSKVLTSTTPNYCRQDSDCDIYSFCDMTSNRCTVQSKQCPGDCLIKGFCYFSDINTGIFLNDCKVNDITCEAICRCTNSYSGISCEMSLDELKKRQVIRSQLISLLYDLILNDDISIENLVAWSRSLSSCSQNQFELSYDAAHFAERIADIIVKAAIQLNLDRPDELTGILQSIDSITSVERYNYIPANLNNALESASTVVFNNYSASRIEDRIGQYSDLVTQGMVMGQKEIKYIYRNFRISTVLMSIDESRSTDLSIAKTALENSRSLKRSSVSLISNNNSLQSSTLAISIVETLAKSYGSNSYAFNSNPIRIKLAKANNIENISYVNSILSQISFNLIHNLNHRYHKSLSNGAKNFTTLCHGSSDYSLHTYLCKSIDFVISRNCSGKLILYVDTCPSYKPICGNINITSGSLTQNLLCVVANYSVDITTCACTLRGEDSKRSNSRALSTSLDFFLGSTGLTSIVDSSQYISADLMETIVTEISGSPSDVFSQIYITVVILSCLWGFGFLISIYILFKYSYNKDNCNRNDRIIESRRIRNYKKDKHFQNNVICYINSLFPAVYSESTSFDALIKELSERHLYFSLFSSTLNFRSIYSRYYKLLKLLTIQTMMIFLLALLYDIQNPGDDGSCLLNTNQASCLFRKRLLDNSISYCSWDSDRCLFSDSPDSLKTFFYIIIISSVITSILSTPIDLLFNILDSPTKFPTVNQSNNSPKTSNRSIKSKSNIYNLSEKISRARQQTQINKISNSIIKRGSIYPLTKNTIQEPITNFLTAILENRKFLLSLKSNEVEFYSYEWSIELYDNHNMDLFTINDLTKSCIYKSMLEISEIVESTKLRLGESSEDQIGFTILHYFLLDLIGYKSIIGKIFNNKFEEDFQIFTFIPIYQKIFVFVAIIALDSFFVYYIIVKSYNKGLEWQTNFMYAILYQFLIEILFNSTLECCWINFIIPSVLRNDITEIKDLIIKTVDSYFRDNVYNYKLDSPLYLFISTQLALYYPDILESQIVLSHHSYFPGSISKAWNKNKVFNINNNNNNRNSDSNYHIVLIFLWYFFQLIRYSASVPYMYQRVFIRLLQPILFSGLVIVYYVVINDPVLISIISLLIGMLILYSVYKYYLYANKTKVSISPIIQPFSKSSSSSSSDDDDNITDTYDNNWLSSSKSSEYSYRVSESSYKDVASDSDNFEDNISEFSDDNISNEYDQSNTSYSNNDNTGVRSIISVIKNEENASGDDSYDDTGSNSY